MVCRIQLTYDEIIDVLEMKYFPSERTGYTLPPRLNEINDINKTLENISPIIVEVSFTINDTR